MIKKTSRSSKSVGSEFWGGQKIEVYKKGLTTLFFPFKAGYYRAGACTDISLAYSYFQNGALKIGMSAAQRWFCPTPSRTTFAVRRPTDPNTEYRISNRGDVGIVRAPRYSAAPNLYAASRIPSIDGEVWSAATFLSLGESTYVGVSRGELALTSRKGAQATLSKGDTAQVTDVGIRVYQSTGAYQRVDLFGDRAQFYTQDPSSLIYINGEYVPQGAIAWHPRHLKIETISGKCYETDLQAVWPKLSKNY